jgi:hypothetical protein
MDIGSSEWLAMQNSDTAETRITPKLLFHPAFRIKTGLHPAVQMLYWLLPSQQSKKQQTASNGGGWILWSGRGQMGETTGSISQRSTTSHQQIHLPQTAPTQRSQHASTWHPPHRDQILQGRIIRYTTKSVPLSATI